MTLDAFPAQVAELLTHLYDPAYLQRHPAARLVVPSNGTDQSLGQQVRRALLKALDQLDPGPRVPARSPNKREHSVLMMRYVEQLTVKEIARELDISERQVYRDLSHAVANLAALLSEGADVQERQSRDELISREASRLRGAVELVDVIDMAEQALETAAPLAQQRQVQVCMENVPDAPVIASNPLILRQAILGSLSYAIQHAAPNSQIDLGIAFETDALYIRLGYVSEDALSGAGFLGAVGALIQQINGHCAVDVQGQRTVLILTIDPPLRPTLLVIDDNAGMADLFRHYLAQDNYQVIGATTGAEGLRMAQEYQPDAIVLDVMIPGSDGWEILKRLRSNESTCSIPIVICSVLDDPQLAYSLGADAFVAKPVTGPRLREVLRGSLDRLVDTTRAAS